MFLLLPLLISQSHAATTDKYQVKGNILSASGWVQSDSCTYNWVYVVGADQVSHSTGSPVPSTYGWVDTETYNNCTGSWSGSWGYLDSLTISGSSLSGTGTVYDYLTGTSSTVTVSASVKGNYSYKDNSVEGIRFGGGKLRYHATMQAKEGDGTVTINGVTTSAFGYYGNASNFELDYTKN